LKCFFFILPFQGVFLFFSFLSQGVAIGLDYSRLSALLKISSEHDCDLPYAIGYRLSA
jgi:hypothetical protein